MITRLRLRNWKSHQDSSFAFSRGVNAILGIMGSGKSSVMDAIAFGLFGTFPAVQGRKLALDDVIMQLPSRKEAASVELEFLAGGRTYQVLREISRGKGSTAELREEGVLKEVSARGVTREVERILGMDYDLFSKAVYAEQNGLDYFLKIPTGQRRAHIDRMLRLDRFELARTEAVALEGKVRAGREERARILGQLEQENLPERAAAAAAEVQSLQEAIALAEEGRQAAAIQRQALQEQIGSAEEADLLLQKTLRLLEGLRGGMDEITLREGRNRKIVRGKDLAQLEAELKGLEKGLGEKRLQLDAVTRRVQDAKTRRTLAEEAKGRVAGVKGQCPLCGNPVSPDRKALLIRERDGQISSLQEEVALGLQEAARIQGEIAALEQRIADGRLERERVLHAYREIKEMEEKVQELLRVKGEHEARVSLLQEQLAGTELRTLRHQREDAVARERSLETELRGQRQRLADKEALLADCLRRLEMLERSRAELQREERIADALDKFGKALRSTQEQLRTTFLGNVNLLMASLWRELYPYGDFASARLGVEEGDYVLQLQRGEWQDAETVSGGERSLACLSLRIAFSLAFLPQLKWLILDEQAISALAQVMRERLPQFAEQVFVITHDSALSAGLPQVHRLERDKGRGEATAVVQ
ncbi:MAG: AAA family ATPase [Candidatus Aenigmarchaeota archaeon]|nr:AAA family ATPase [Candidatus Aenigmarchaeota archaeon]